MSVYASHPSDRVAQAGASLTDSVVLTRDYERIFDVVEDRRGKLGAYGALQALCSLAIARVELLEQREDRRQRAASPPILRRPRRRTGVVSSSERDERRARSELYPAGEVIPLPTGRRDG